MGEVAGLKAFLQHFGAYKGSVDDTWNDELTDTLAWWQGTQGLTPSGSFDIATRGKIDSILRFVSGNTQGGNTDPRIREEAINRYGPGFAAYLADPEWGPIIAKGALEGRDDKWLQGQLQGTNKWKQQSEARRAWDQLKATDPSSASRRLDDAFNQVRDLAGRIGLQLSNTAIRRLADDKNGFNWSDDELTDVLASQVQFNPTAPDSAGQIGVLVSDLKNRAAGQLLNLNDQTAFDMAKKIVMGESTVDAADVTFKAQAKAKAPHLAELIDNGITLGDYFAQHKERMANLLEVGSDAIDFVNDPRWAQVINYNDNGKIRSMTETEAEKLARSQQEWKSTRNAQSAGADIEVTANKIFGVM